MHKEAKDLKKRDCFSMAGGHYEVIDIYEVSDEAYIKFSFAPLLESYTVGTITVHKSLMIWTL